MRDESLPAVNPFPLPRQVPGDDPAGAQDWFSLDQTGDDWRKVFSGNSSYISPMLAVAQIDPRWSASVERCASAPG